MVKVKMVLGLFFLWVVLAFIVRVDGLRMSLIKVLDEKLDVISTGVVKKIEQSLPLTEREVSLLESLHLKTRDEFLSTVLGYKASMGCCPTNVVLKDISFFVIKVCSHYPKIMNQPT